MSDWIDLDRAEPLPAGLERRWSAKPKTYVSSTVICDGMLVTGEKTGSVTAYDLDDGAVRWTTRLGGELLQPLFVSQGWIWGLHEKGSLAAIDLRGKVVRKLAAQGWSVQHHDGKVCYFEQVGKWRRAPGSDHACDGVPTLLDLTTGKRVALGAKTTMGWDGWHRANVAVIAGENAAVYYHDDELVKVSLQNGKVLEKHPLPGCTGAAGLLARPGLIAIATRIASMPPLPKLLQRHPTPVTVRLGKKSIGLPIRIDARYHLHPSLVALDEKRWLLEMGETLVRLGPKGVEKSVSLPKATLLRDHTVGLFPVAGGLMVFRWQYLQDSAREFGLEGWKVDPSTLALKPFARLRFGPNGKSRQRPEIDGHGDLLVARGDGRLHVMRAAQRSPLPARAARSAD